MLERSGAVPSSFTFCALNCLCVIRFTVEFQLLSISACSNRRLSEKEQPSTYPLDLLYKKMMGL